jgi:hypothetical protein
MTIYSDLANAKTDINTNIGSQTSARAITPTVHAGVLDNVVETVFQYSAGTGVDTLREALLDSGLTFLYVPESTFVAPSGTGVFKFERTTTDNWRKIEGIGTAVLEKVNYESSHLLDLHNESDTGSSGQLWIEGLKFDGKATADPDHFDQSSSAIYLGEISSGHERVDDIRLFFNDFHDQSTSAVYNTVGGNDYELFFNRADNMGGEAYSIAGSQWGMYGFNRVSTNGSYGLALNSGSAWNVVIGNIVKSGSADFTNNADSAFKVNGYGNVLLGNISWQSRGHITAINNTGYESNANQTYSCQHSVFAFNMGHGLAPPDETSPQDQYGYNVQGNLNLFFGNSNNTVQATDKVGESLGDSIGTCHPVMKIAECGRLDFQYEIFEGGPIELATSGARHVKFKDCKFFMWGNQSGTNWYDTHIFKCLEDSKINRLDFVDCEFDNACGCIIRMMDNSKINQVNIENCEEILWNNVAELAGDENSTTAIEINDTPITLDISRVATDWKGWRAAWPSGQEFYLCTFGTGTPYEIVYDVITIAEDVYPNMGSSSSVTIDIEEFTATNRYLHKNSWLALKKRTAIDTTRGIIYSDNNAYVETINITDNTFLGSNYSLSGYEISAGDGIVNTATLNGSGVDPSGTISGVPV